MWYGGSKPKNQPACVAENMAELKARLDEANRQSRGRSMVLHLHFVSDFLHRGQAYLLPFLSGAAPPSERS